MRLFSKKSILGSFFLLSLTTSASFAMEDRDPLDAAERSLRVTRAGVADLNAAADALETEKAAVAANMQKLTDSVEDFRVGRAATLEAAKETAEAAHDLAATTDQLVVSSQAFSDALDGSQDAMRQLGTSLERQTEKLQQLRDGTEKWAAAVQRGDIQYPEENKARARERMRQFREEQARQNQ